MIARYFFLCAVVLLGACATPDYNYRPAVVRLSEPVLDSEGIARVGDALIKQGRYTKHESIFLPQRIEIGWGYTLLPGYYLKNGEDENTETFSPMGRDEVGSIEKAWWASLWRAVVAYKKKDKLCVLTVYNALICEKTSHFERRVKPTSSSGSFQRRLVYQGKAGNTIKFSYREYSNSLTNPALDEQVDHNLSESSLLEYKGARIEVIEATDDLVRYRVLSSFDRSKIHVNREP